MPHAEDGRFRGLASSPPSQEHRSFVRYCVPRMVA